MQVTWKHRIIIGQRIKTRVIAERPLAAQRLGWIDVAFDDDIRVRRHFDIDGDAFDQLDAFLAQEAGEEDLIDLRRQRRGGGVDHRRIAAEADRQLQLALVFFLLLEMAAPTLCRCQCMPVVR